MLLVDYRGYGGNPGLPSERGLANDARAALAYVAHRLDVDPLKLVYFGESLGAAVAVRLAVEYPPAALVLRSPFSSLAAVAEHRWRVLLPRWLLWDPYSSISRIGDIASPLVVIASEADRVVPFEDSEHLFDAAPQPKRLVVLHDADHHDDALVAGPIVVRAVLDLLAGWAPTSLT